LKGSRPPPIRIASYEKTTIDNGYTPKLERADPMDGLLGARENLGKSTSRPGTPVRHHSRVGSSRGKVKREE
jgi:UDP-sugar transporter A1/2/3